MKRHLRRVHDEQDGLVSVVAMVILLPLMFLFVGLGVQATVAARANQVAAHAAQEGVRAWRDRNGSLRAGVNEANAVLQALSPGVLQDRSITTSTDGDVVRIEVSGTAMSVVPGFTPQIRVVSEAKIEKFRSRV